MSTVAIILIVIGVLIVIALIAAAARRKSQQRDLEARQVAGEHREEATSRRLSADKQAAAADEQAARARREAAEAEERARNAERERETASAHEEHAERIDPDASERHRRRPAGGRAGLPRRRPDRLAQSPRRAAVQPRPVARRSVEGDRQPSPPESSGAPISVQPPGERAEAELRELAVLDAEHVPGALARRRDRLGDGGQQVDAAARGPPPPSPAPRPPPRCRNYVP